MADDKSTKLSPWAKDERGNVYGRLTVVEVAGKQGGQLLWDCLCECGNLTKVTGGDLRRGTTKSCGCGRRMKGKPGGKHKIGGGCKSPEYISWKEMKRRCYNPNNKGYKWYGALGITICDEWRTSFLTFLSDMGPRPTPEHTIERINGKLGYFKENCKWATPMEQSANIKNNVFLTFNGETLHIRAWARKLGVQHCTIRYRLKQGWPLEKVLTSERFFSPPPIKKARKSNTD